MEETARKVYVDVIAKTDKNGLTHPLSITWEDGQVYEIDRVRTRRRAAATKVGGVGLRYTVVIRGRETYLFHEENKWFVEAKEKVS